MLRITGKELDGKTAACYERMTKWLKRFDLDVEIDKGRITNLGEYWTVDIRKNICNRRMAYVAMRWIGDSYCEAVQNFLFDGTYTQSFFTQVRTERCTYSKIFNEEFKRYIQGLTEISIENPRTGEELEMWLDLQGI